MEFFPKWADVEFFERVFLGAWGSPFCKRLLEASSSNDTTFNSTVALNPYQTGRLSCDDFR